jgi:hypothetical protein
MQDSLVNSMVVGGPAEKISWLEGTQFVVFMDESKLTPWIYEKYHKNNNAGRWADDVDRFVVEVKPRVNQVIKLEEYNKRVNRQETQFQSALTKISTQISDS